MGLKPRAGQAIVSAFAIASVALLPSAHAAVNPPASRYASIVMEAETGAILYERNADLPRHPASLTKIMTLYLAFEALAAKKLAMTDQLTISSYAAGRDPSRLDLSPGSKLRLEDAIRAITTKSANDAACAIGETLGKGSERRFADAMNAKAKTLGLKRTRFLNASGLPEDGQLTSARDLALLCKALVRDFPEYYRYFSTDTFDFHGTRYPNQNRFLQTYYGADGIKTGFVNASGHNLAASAVRGGKRLIAIVLGGDTQAWTREHATRLLDVSYAKIDPSLVMVASNAAPAEPGTGSEPATAAAPATAPAVTTVSTPAGAVTIASAQALPLPNATANLKAFAAAASAPKLPAGSVGAPGTSAATPAPTAAPTPAPAAMPVAAPAAANAVPASTATAVKNAAPAAAAVTAKPVPVPAAAAATTRPAAAPTAASVTTGAVPVADRATAQRSAQPAASNPASSTAIVATTPSTSRPETAAPLRAREGAGAVAVPASLPQAPAAGPSAADSAQESRNDSRNAGEPAPAMAGGDWSVQVGLFRDATVARRRGEEARNQMPLSLRGADLIVGRALDGVNISSRIGRLSERDAREACTQLQRGRVPCVVVPPGRPLVVATN